MSREQLDRAYALIKAGQTQEAISSIETVIRADRDNENAWWLLANATTDPAAKRNALNNVIRLTENAERADKARAMLQALTNDPYSFDDKSEISSQASSYKATPRTGGYQGCGKIALGLVAVIGLCACISGFGIFWVARPIFDAIQIPSSYDSQGNIDGSSSLTGSISPDAPIDGFVYHGTEGEQIHISVSSDNEYSPFVFIYSVETGSLVNLGQASAPNSPTQVSFAIPSTGNYLITVRSFALFGQDLGSGNYTLKIEVD